MVCSAQGKRGFVVFSRGPIVAQELKGLPPQGIEMSLFRRQTDGRGEVLDCRLKRVGAKVQAATMLKRLPELRTQADRFRQNSDRLPGLTGSSQSDGPF